MPFGPRAFTGSALRRPGGTLSIATRPVSSSTAPGESSFTARGLIIYGPAHHGASGSAMPTDEGDQDGHFFFNHPERGDYLAA